MRLFWLLLLLLALVAPAQAQRTTAHDGTYEGTRFQECQRTGRSGQARIVGTIRNGSLTLPGLPGDPPLEAVVGPNGAVTLPSFGLFGPGTGQIFEGADNARRFTGSHPGRGQCQMVYELRRSSTRVRS